eukprot:gene26327-55939_t
MRCELDGSNPVAIVTDTRYAWFPDGQQVDSKNKKELHLDAERQQLYSSRRV